MHLVEISKAPVLALVLSSFKLSFLWAWRTSCLWYNSWQASFQFTVVLLSLMFYLHLFSDTHLAEWLMLCCLIKPDLTLGHMGTGPVSPLATSPRLQRTQLCCHRANRSMGHFFPVMMATQASYLQCCPDVGPTDHRSLCVFHHISVSHSKCTVPRILLIQNYDP